MMMHMTSRPRISVAIATYNGEKFIEGQLASIFAQTLLPDEVVICDDGSSDSTVEHLNKFQQQYPDQLHIYRNQENVGYTRNFEKVVSQCKGDIIVLSDQDDYWLPHKLERIAIAFQENPHCGLVFSDAEVTDSALNSMGYTIYSHFTKPDLRPTILPRVFAREMRLLGCTSAFRAKYIPYLFPISSSIWGHDHWIAFVLSIISELHMIEEPLMLYRRHDKNATDGSAWERGAVSKVIRKQQNLSLAREHRERSYRKWNDMLQHLYRLQEMGTINDASALEDGIATVRARIDFDRCRLAMQSQPRVLRLISAFRLLKNGDYNRYTPGARTFVKDLVV